MVKFDHLAGQLEEPIRMRVVADGMLNECEQFRIDDLKLLRTVWWNFFSLISPIYNPPSAAYFSQVEVE
jgi:hypothetical protein